MDVNNKTKYMKSAGFGLLLLLIEVYVISSVYNQVHFINHLILCIFFVTLIVWLYLAKPLGRKSFDRNMHLMFRFIYGLSIAGTILALLRTDIIGQWLGGFALIPVNILLTVSCLVEPAANLKLK